MMHASSRTWHRAKSVLIVDDHPVVRRGIRALVEGATDLEVVGEADNGFDALDLAAATGPDIVVMDLSMPQLGGIETLTEMRRRQPDIEVLIFSLHQSEQFLRQATEAGARGYVSKAESDHLLPALEAVARREAYFSPTLGDAFAGESDDEAWDRRPLTLRERQVVKFVAEGFSNKEIARKLNISVKTAETHRSSAMRKTGTNSATGLTLYAARNGLVEL
jgi:DNA-binding NarL/FixJ family response regulator